MTAAFAIPGSLTRMPQHQAPSGKPNPTVLVYPKLPGLGKVESDPEAYAWLTLMFSPLEVGDDPRHSPLHGAVEEVLSLTWKDGDPPMALRKIEHVPVRSSNIRSVGYDEEGGILEIWFLSGSVYRYTSVPKSVYDTLVAASSVGRTFNDTVKDIFPYRKIADRVTSVPMKKGYR